MASHYLETIPRPPDFEADIYFLATSVGGRQSPAPNGFRCCHDMGLMGEINDALHEYIDCDTAVPGDTVKTRLWLLVPESQTERLFPGFKFTVQEGPRIVGHGTILNVMNPILRSNTLKNS